MSDLKMPDITSGLANKIRAITLFKKKKKEKRKNKTTFESEHFFTRLVGQNRQRKGCPYFMVGLSIQTRCGDEACVVLSA